jgi:hypothetical protein
MGHPPFCSAGRWESPPLATGIPRIPVLLDASLSTNAFSAASGPIELFDSYLSSSIVIVMASAFLLRKLAMVLTLTYFCRASQPHRGWTGHQQCWFWSSRMRNRICSEQPLFPPQYTNCSVLGPGFDGTAAPSSALSLTPLTKPL